MKKRAPRALYLFIELALVYSIAFITIQSVFPSPPRAIFDLPLINNIPGSRYVGDEEGEVKSDQFFFQAFVLEKNIFHPIWYLNLGNFGYCEPKIGKYIIGFFDLLLRKLGQRVDPLVYIPRTDAEYYRHRDPPEGRYVAQMRYFMGFLAAGCVCGIYFLGRLYSKLAGSFAALFLMINPIFRCFQTFLITIIPMLFFTFLALILFCRIDKELQEGRPAMKWMVLAGLVTGVALGCRLYSLPLYPMFLIVLFKNRGQLSHQGLAAGLFLFLLSSSAVFVLGDPRLYTDFNSGVFAMTFGKLYGRRNPIPLSHLDFSWALDVLTYPLVPYLPPPFRFRHLPHFFSDPWNYFFILPGWILVICRLSKMEWKKDFLPLSWMAVNFLFTAWLTFALINRAIPEDHRRPMPQTFIVLSTATIWFVSGLFRQPWVPFGLKGKLQKIRSRPRS